VHSYIKTAHYLDRKALSKPLQEPAKYYYKKLISYYLKRIEKLLFTHIHKYQVIN